MAERHMLHHGVHCRSFCHIPFHELQPGGRVIKQVADDHSGALWAAHHFPFHHLAPFQRQARAKFPVCGTGHQLHSSYGGDGRQGFAPKAQGADGLQIKGVLNLAGGVAQKGGLRILRLHAAAVIGDPNVAHAAPLDLHRHRSGASINGILRQLLHHAGRTLYHLTGSDQIGHMAFQTVDFRHFRSPPVIIYPSSLAFQP